MFLFIIFGAIAIAAGLGVIFSRKPTYSALFLLVNFVCLAAFYVMLQAQYLAMVQVIVYAGAIVVLFLFVVMLIGGGELLDLPTGGLRNRANLPRGVVVVALTLLLVAGLAYGVIAGRLPTTQGAAAAFGQGSVEAVGQALFGAYLLPFELASVLLLVGMIGAVVLARKD
ncbi:MAG TPA: NADH-quinone oxidoreductase subunit J [Anaerolineae bacterium]